MRRVMTLLASAFGETAGGLLGWNAAVDLDNLGIEGPNFGALIVAPGSEIRLEHDGRTVRREGPQQFHRVRSDVVGELCIAGRTVHRGKKAFFDVVFGEQRKAEKLGERACEGGLAGSGRTRDEHDATFQSETHSSILNGGDTGWVIGMTPISHAGWG